MAAEGMISHPFVEDQRIAGYGQQLWRARWAGRVVGALHTLCSILAFCNLTWATVVLLGAYVNSLLHADYYIVFTLLLLEASRLASASFFTHLLTRVPNPGHVPSQEQRTRAQHNGRQSLLFRLLSSLLQILLIAPSFVCSIIRSSRIHYPADLNTRNLQASLRIFYSLVMVNAAVSFMIVLLAFIAWVYFERLSEKSVLKYYDEILSNTLIQGVVKADNFNFFIFAFGLMGRDYTSYKPWGRVVAENRELLRYLYADKQGSGYLQACLGSEDAAVRQAAANMVGAWAYGVGQEVQLPVELLTTLADTVGTGEVGWAAVNSFGALARNNPRCVIKTRTSSGQPVLHRIVELVDRHSTRSLASVRTLILFYDKRQATGLHQAQGTELAAAPITNVLTHWELPRNLQEHLTEDLKSLLRENPIQRIRVQAAYLLYMLHGNLFINDADSRDQVQNILPNRDTHWFKNEKQMLERLYFMMSIPVPAASSYPSDLRSSPESLLLAELDTTSRVIGGTQQ